MPKAARFTPWSKAEIRLLKKMAKDGLNDHEIAKQFTEAGRKISSSGISQRRKVLGIASGVTRGRVPRGTKKTAPRAARPVATEKVSPAQNGANGISTSKLGDVLEALADTNPDILETVALRAGAAVLRNTDSVELSVRTE